MTGDPIIEKQSVLVHVHVPKTAGTSVRTWLNRAYPDTLGLFFTQFIFTDETLEIAGIGNPALRVACSHTIRTFHPNVAGRRLHYFTLLRNPVTHVLSFARYVEQIEEDPYGKKILDQGMESRKTREYVAKTLERAPEQAFSENTQTNFFALHEWCERTAKTRGCDPLKYPDWAAAAREAYLRERLEVAKSVLRSFLCVGTVERLHDSLELLRVRGAALGYELLPASEIGFQNVTTIGVDDLKWLNQDDPIGRRLGAAIEEDIQLWLFVQQNLLVPAAGAS